MPILRLNFQRTNIQTVQLLAESNLVAAYFQNLVLVNLCVHLVLWWIVAGLDVDAPHRLRPMQTLEFRVLFTKLFAAFHWLSIIVIHSGAGCAWLELVFITLVQKVQVSHRRLVDRLPLD